MAVTTRDKGKGKALPEEHQADDIEHAASSASASSSGSDTDSDSDTSDDSESEDDEITQEQLDSLLEKARQKALSSSSQEVPQIAFSGEEEVIRLGNDEDADERYVRTRSVV